MTKRRRVATYLILATTFLTAACSGDISSDENGNSTWAESFAACMSEAGWPVQIAEDGGVESEFPESQRDVFRAQEILCAERSAPGSDPTEAQFEAGYEGLLEDRLCIVEAGYELPPPPTYQAWRDINGQWNPFVDLPDSLTGDEMEHLIEICTPTGL